MAQHVPTRSFPQKVFRGIEQSIRKEVARGYLRGSLKYERLPDSYRNLEDSDVFATTRYIGKGFVYGDERGYFEVHINGKEVNTIYLVA